jgi:transposase
MQRSLNNERCLYFDGLKEKQRSGRPSKARNQNHTKLLQSILAMQNNKNGGSVRLKDIQNMLAKDFNNHQVVEFFLVLFCW